MAYSWSLRQSGLEPYTKSLGYGRIESAFCQRTEKKGLIFVLQTVCRAYTSVISVDSHLSREVGV